MTLDHKTSHKCPFFEIEFSIIGSLMLPESSSHVGNVLWRYTVSVLNVWDCRTHARRFMGFLNANFAKVSISEPSALRLRCLKRSHPCFPVAPRRSPRPLVSPRPGVQMLSSRLWRVSRQASPFHWLNSRTNIFILARGHVTPSPSG